MKLYTAHTKYLDFFGKICHARDVLLVLSNKIVNDDGSTSLHAYEYTRYACFSHVDKGANKQSSSTRAEEIAVSHIPAFYCYLLKYTCRKSSRSLTNSKAAKLLINVPFLSRKSVLRDTKILFSLKKLRLNTNLWKGF